METKSRLKRKWSELKTCPICGQSGGWCTTDGVVVKCMRAKSNREVKQRDGGIAYIHPITAVTTKVELRGKLQKRPPLTAPELRILIKKHQSALSDKRLEMSAKSLNLLPQSLLAYGAGWDVERGALSFPMYDGNLDGRGNLVPCGIRLRSTSGAKAAVPGSRNGIFVPNDFLESQRIAEGIAGGTAPLVILTPEGPTDSCAAADKGYRAIGRPGNVGGADAIVRLLNSTDPQEVVVVSDRDEPKLLKPSNVPYWPGIEGALSLIKRLLSLNKTGMSIRFMMPPEGFKDLRAWLPTLTSGADLHVAVYQSRVVTPAWLAAAEARITSMKKEWKPKAA